MAIETVITQMAAVEATITGLSTGRCFDLAPIRVQVSLPAVLNLIRSGGIERGVGLGMRETTHVVEVMCLVANPGSDLPTAETLARPYVKRFIDKFDDNKTMNGSCFTSNITSYRYGEIPLRPGEPGYLGVVFTVDVYEDETGVLYSD